MGRMQPGDYRALVAQHKALTSPDDERRNSLIRQLKFRVWRSEKLEAVGWLKAMQIT